MIEVVALDRGRRTLCQPLEVTGKGVHGGKSVTARIVPAQPGEGYQFIRTDLPGKPTIAATVENLATDKLLRRTTLKSDDTVVYTIEHILSALRGCNIDDATIEMDGEEAPFVDGSALPFVKALTKVGTQESSTPATALRVVRPFAYLDNEAEVVAAPDTQLRVSYYFNSEHPMLRNQHYNCILDEATYAEEIAPARTFCFFEEIEMMRKSGLIKGANLNSAVVIGRKGIINSSLRFEEEMVRHKILDFIGDLSLLGMPLQGHFISWKSGHRVNAGFASYIKKELLN